MVLGWPGVINGNEPDSENSICCFSIQPQDLLSFIFQISAKTITGNSWGLEKGVVYNSWQQISLPGL